MALKPIAAVQKESSACAIFGAISYSKKGVQPKPIPAKVAIDAILEAQNERGGEYGNGIMLASPDSQTRAKTLSIWAKEKDIAERIFRMLSDDGLHLSGLIRAGSGEIYFAYSHDSYFHLLSSVVKANAAVHLDEGRIISFGHGMELYKGLESLEKLDRIYGLGEKHAYAMIAHTRYPTGSSPKVVRAHPFGFGNVGIVHNGDVTSYSANLAACESLLGELYHRFTSNSVGEFIRTLHKSWVGTDSEIIAAMLYSLLKAGRVTNPDLSIMGAMEIMVPMFDNHLTSLLRGSSERMRLEQLAYDYQGFALDGPVSCIALINSENDVYMLAFRDRNDFRPLQIVIDHENQVAYAASELRQIIAATGLDIFSPKVESYTPDSGKFLLVSSRLGIIYPGREQRPWISVPKLPRILPKINGKPYQFAGEEISSHIQVYGLLGNHGGSYSYGPGTLEIAGSVDNNAFEASSLDTVIVHGNCSMMVGNSFKGRAFYVRGAADSRAFSQLRPLNGRAPVAIIGETAGKYLGKMMSAGTIVVLGLENLGKEDVDSQIVGDFLMTGAVGGEAYIRGYVQDERIGRRPSRRNVIAVCSALRDEGIITESALREIRHNPLNLERILKIIQDHQEEKSPESFEHAKERISRLFPGNLLVERRPLAPDEKEKLLPYLEEYCQTFGLNGSTLGKVLSSSYTIVKARPQEN